jgi:hypothetical protein
MNHVFCILQSQIVKAMWTLELIKEINGLSVQKRLYVIEKTIHSIRKQEDINQMKKAANLLLSDYKTDEELTAFTNLDYADFYEAK